MKKIFVTILILTFVFSLVSNSYADEKAVGDAIWDKITTHIDDATGNIDAIEIHIKADVGTGTAYILDYPGFWTVLNGIGLCDNPGQEGGVGIRVFKNYPDTTTVTNQIQGYATTGCEYGDNIFRIYFADSLDNPITFDPCTNPLLGMGYVNRGTLDIPVEDYLGFPGLLLNWWPKAVIPPKPAFTAMTVQDSLDGCASFPYWNVLVNDSTYHVTDSCDYNYQWGKFALKVNGDPGSSYYVDLKDGYDTDVNFKLKDLQYFPFYLDITSLPDPVGFYDWWYVKGVNASAGSGTWQEWMWKIVGLGTEPMFYVYYDENGANPPIYKIIDGLQKDYGMTDQYLRVNGDYPQGDYIFYGEIEGCNDELSETVYVKIDIESCPPPHVIDITAETYPTGYSSTLVDDCTDSLIVCIEFDDDMNTFVNPTVSYTPDVSSPIVLPPPYYTGWTTNRIYCLKYYLTSLIDIDVDDIDVSVSGAVNEYCCPQDPDPDTELDVFSIYTLNPEGTITLTPPDLIDNCVDTFKVQICYDDLMCETVDPVINFLTAAKTCSLLNVVGTPSWISNNCYEWVYEVLDCAMLGTVQVVIDSAQNWTCCNVQEPDTAYFYVDTEIPEATLTALPNPVNGCYIDSIFTVTATYNDSMCLTVDPTIAFDPDVTTHTLNFQASYWTTYKGLAGDKYTWEYKILDADTTINDVQIIVAGAQDWTCCNEQEPDTTYFDINTDSPIVSLIDVTPPLLTRCVDSLQICITYDRKMDTTFEPNIVFNPDVSTYFTIFYGGTWSPDSLVYCKLYGWTAWPEIDEDCIDIEVSDARGAVDTCSIQIPDTCFCCLEIDWDKPEVVTITSSDLCVGSCDTDFSVTVVYDEPMCYSPLPTITFANPAPCPDPFTLVPATSTWTDNYTAEINYLVTDVNAYGCDVDIIVTDALDATCCSLNVQYPDTLFDAFNVDQIEPGSILSNAHYNDTTCTISFDWVAWDIGCPDSCISKVEFYVWKDGGMPGLVYTDVTGNTSGSLYYDLATLPVPDTLCLEGMWYGYSKAYDCCCNVEPTPAQPDDSVNVSIAATKFVVTAKEHQTGSDTLYQGRYFDVIVVAVNDCGLRDCDFACCLSSGSNYPADVVLFDDGQLIMDGYGVYPNNLAYQTMNDLQINVHCSIICCFYGISDPITVILPPIEPPTNTLAYDLPDDQGGWVTIDYTLSLNDPFNSIHNPTTNPAYLPFIDYYVIARNSQPDTSGTWDAIAFVDLYNPLDSNNAHVDIEVPAGDTLYPYVMAAVYSDTKLFGGKENDLASKKTLRGKSDKIDSPEVIYLADNPDLIKGAQQSDWSSCGSAAGKDNIPAYANFTLFLEGPYQAGSTMLNGMVLPTKSPYDGDDIGILPTVAGHDLIDWIYVELRNTETGETVQEANAFVIDNGKIVDTNGNYSLPFHYTTGNQYYIVIHHRNHLDVMSAERKFFGDSQSEATNINLSTVGSVYNNGFKLVETGVYALYTGDASGNNEVQNDDKNDYWKLQVGQAGYLSADFNLNGQVQNNDKNDYWRYNVGKGSQVPTQAKNANNNRGVVKGSNDSLNKDHIGIFFTFDNGFLAADHSYYEFDVMVAAQFDGTKLGDTQTYIDYSTLGFGERIVDNSKITVEKGILVQGDFGTSGVALYTLTIEDNTPSKVSIVYSYNFDALPDFGNSVFTTPTQLMRIRIYIDDEHATAGLSFDQGLMTGQQYVSDNDPDNKYDPITAVDTDNSTLPVELSSFNAIFSSANENIEMNWKTESETNVIGFNIYRSEIKDLTRAGRHINYSLLDAAGTTTEPQRYVYYDVVADVYATHYYWLEVVDLGGTSSLHGPIAYIPGDLDGDSIPDLIADTELIGSWPNPAVNSTKIQYQLKGSVIDQNATITVYNIRGELVKTVNGTNGVATLDTSDLGQGIYFYRLQTDDFSEIKKLIVVK